MKKIPNAIYIKQKKMGIWSHHLVNSIFQKIFKESFKWK